MLHDRIARRDFSDLTAEQEEMCELCLKEIESESFYRCESLTTAELGRGTERLGDRAFYGCRALERLTLPGSLASIGERAFDGCPRLTVRAPRGSFAWDYAEKHGLAREASEE